MENTLHPADRHHLRVLLVGSVTGASLALAGWLEQQGCLAVVGPVAATPAVATYAAAHQPQVIVLDVDSLTLSLSNCISHLKALAPQPTLIVLACDTSDVLRRRCHGAGVDMVFSKTRELEGLANQLAVLHAKLYPASSRSLMVGSTTPFAS